MKKNIKDYLHLYLGCEFEYLSGSRTYIDIIKSVGTTINLTYAPTDIKPILRPLSDMTGSEEDEINTLQITHDDEFIKSKMYDAEMIRILLSKHFDLFGLIDAEIAIDKTKLIISK